MPVHDPTATNKVLLAMARLIVLISVDGYSVPRRCDSIKDRHPQNAPIALST